MSTILGLHRALIAVERASSGNGHVVAWVEVVAPRTANSASGTALQGQAVPVELGGALISKPASAATSSALANGFCRTTLRGTPSAAHCAALSPVMYTTAMAGNLSRARRAICQPSAPGPGEYR